ncbi:MAG: hypothetical protein JOZ77_12805 [Candidatus Eremiobacteraeota bacterium]|nr:hypothetical protein [Candidatus Eremiobacteraeota bacterium]
MRTSSSLFAFTLSAVLLAACSSNNSLNIASPSSRLQQGAQQHTLGEISPSKKKKAQLLYVADTSGNLINVYSLPKYTLTAQITDGVDEPEGITTDKKGQLYVTNYGYDTITIYKTGTTKAALTLDESDGPDDVAVASNGYVAAGDLDGGVDVYKPGAVKPYERLTNPAIRLVIGVGIDAKNNVYAAGLSSGSTAAVVEYANMTGAGTNLQLAGLSSPAGVLIDEHGDIVISDFGAGVIRIYPPGASEPSSSISVGSPERSALNSKENLIYVPQQYNGLSVLTYPDGALLKTVAGTARGAALSPAPKP